MERTVAVVQGDINDVDADVVALPIGCTLRPARTLAQALFSGSPAALPHLEAVRGREPLGVTPTTVVILPPGSHRLGGRVAVAAVHDDRAGIAAALVEPDEARVRAAATRVFEACDAANAASLVIAPLGGIDMDAHDAAAIAADALVAHWRRSPTGSLRTVRFLEYVPKRVPRLAELLRERFPHVVVPDEATTQVVHAQRAMPPASEVTPAVAPPSTSSVDARPPTIAPITPYGLPRSVKHTARLAFERWLGACGGAPIPAGCAGVAFRFAAPTSTFTVILRVHGAGVKGAWLDGQPLADGRASLALGSHVLAVECNEGPFAVVVDGPPHREMKLAQVRAVADGNVAAAAGAAAGWTALAAGAAFSAVTSPASPEATLPAWASGHGVALPAGTRFVRFVFPLVFEATP